MKVGLQRIGCPIKRRGRTEIDHRSLEAFIYAHFWGFIINMRTFMVHRCCLTGISNLCKSLSY